VLPAPVRRFIEQHIDNASQLELLLLLEHHRERWWSASEVAEALRLGDRDAARELESLGRGGLLDVRLGSEVRYRFGPAVPALGAGVRDLSECYGERRNETLAFVAARGRRSLRAFSDAFRFTKDDDA
jgi:DNA-binding IclR family transcriptional regulator